MNIHEKLSKIQVAFKAKKSRYNSFGRYNFRSAEDILEGLKPFIDEFNVTFKVDETYLGEGVLESKASISDGKDTIHASAIVAVDFDQKGMQMPQKFGSASSYGKKYSLGNLLLIDDTADADATNNHSKTKAKPKLEGDALKKAKEFIKNGGKIEAIKSKYEITPEVLKTL
jgi:hypothetical protein